MSRQFEEMRKAYETRLSEECTRRRDYENRCYEKTFELGQLRGKLELYEKIIDKFLGEKKNTDDVFMFEGKLYLAQAFSLDREVKSADELTVTFVEIPLPKRDLNNYKEKKDA